jgi:ATP-dependent Clp protease ATP-binding subunit ClpC
MLHNYIGCEHLLLGILATEEGLASQVLRRMGAELRTTRRAVVTALSGFVHAKQTLTAAPSAAASVPADDDAMAKILQRLDAIEKRLSDA